MVFVAVVFNAVDVVIRGAVVVDAINVVVLVAGGRWCMLRSTAFVVVIFAGEGDVVFIAVSKERIAALPGPRQVLKISYYSTNYGKIEILP